MIKKMVITDFDGTLGQVNGAVSFNNYKCLEDLGRLNIIRAVATGRSLFSVYKVMSEDFPIDYLIFSSGAGIMDWKTKEIIYKQQIDKSSSNIIKKYLLSKGYSFMLHFAIPDNHCFFHYQGKDIVKDYFNRIEFYKEFSYKENDHIFYNSEFSQFLVIEPSYSKAEITIKKDLFDYNVIRTTSPFDHQSLWIEIFHKEVMKSLGCQRLSQLLGIDRENIMILGNDYNDLDMLEWGIHSYAVENAPKDIKDQFRVVSSADNDGFCEAVEDFLSRK